MNPPDERFPEGTVTIRLHRRKPQHILMDRRDVDLVLAEELEMQRTENKHLKRKLYGQAQYIARLIAENERLRKQAGLYRNIAGFSEGSSDEAVTNGPS